MEIMADNLDLDESAIEKENIPSIPQSTVEQQPGISVTISVESPHEHGGGALASAFSTPLTVKDRVKEYYHRAGGQGDDSSSLSGSKSLSSSQGSLRDFDKDHKEWMLAACACDAPALRRLLTSNRRLVNYKFPFNGFTAMHFAAKMNRPDCCRLLVDSGASADAKTYAGQTPLHMACQHESREAMEYLLKLPSKAAHTPDYSGRLPHELIRNRDAFDEVLCKLPPVTAAQSQCLLLDASFVAAAAAAAGARRGSLTPSLSFSGGGGGSGSGAQRFLSHANQLIYQSMRRRQSNNNNSNANNTTTSGGSSSISSSSYRELSHPPPQLPKIVHMTGISESCPGGGSDEAAASAEGQQQQPPARLLKRCHSCSELCSAHQDEHHEHCDDSK